MTKFHCQCGNEATYIRSVYGWVKQLITVFIFRQRLYRAVLVPDIILTNESKPMIIIGFIFKSEF